MRYFKQCVTLMLAFCLAASLVSAAATLVATTDGNWEDKGTWKLADGKPAGRVPGTRDLVIVKTGVTVTITNDSASKDINCLDNQGTIAGKDGAAGKNGARGGRGTNVSILIAKTMYRRSKNTGTIQGGAGGNPGGSGGSVIIGMRLGYPPKFFTNSGTIAAGQGGSGSASISGGNGGTVDLSELPKVTYVVNDGKLKGGDGGKNGGAGGGNGGHVKTPGNFKNNGEITPGKGEGGGVDGSHIETVAMMPGLDPDNPIYMLLVPWTEGATVEEIGTAIAQALFELTGLYIVPSLQADYTAMIEAFAVSEGDTFGFPTPDQYIRIYERTGGDVEPWLGSVRYGYPWYYSSIYARRGSGITSLEDLSGKVWIYNDTGSTSGYVFPNMLFEQLGLQFSGIVMSGGHTNSMVALIEGQGDFCTGYGSAPGAPEGWSGDMWDFGDDPELWLWDRWNNDLFREEFRGTCFDLRRAVRETYDFDTVMREVAVVWNIGPIPNDCLAFGPEFPSNIAELIVEAVKIHIATEEGQALWGDENFYEWTAVADIDDSFYDGYREILGVPIPEQ